MSMLGSQRDGAPILVSEDGARTPLERISLTSRAIPERFLQDLLHRCPEVLPVEQIEPEFAPLIPIWRPPHELESPVGYMDAMFVSPNGNITIAETKLWRNPEARREVVGQIINYATEVSRWGYEDLDKRVRASTGFSLWEIVRKSPPSPEDMDEGRFVDAVSRTLARGRFLLLIVGDGIREDVERMTEYLQGAPRMHFTLALVELRLHKLDGSKRTLVVPSVLARTVEITRAIVKVDGNGQVNVSVIDQPPTPKPTFITEPEFYQLLEERTKDPQLRKLVESAVNQFRDLPFYVETGKATLMVRLADPQRIHDFTMLGFTSYGTVWQYYFHYQLRTRAIEEDLTAGLDFLKKSAALVGRALKPDKEGDLSWNKEAPVRQVMPHFDELADLLREFARRIGAYR